MTGQKSSGVGRGGGDLSRATAKLRLYLKFGKGKRVLKGRKILGRDYKRVVDERKVGIAQKMVVKKFWGMRQESRGAVNIRSASGGNLATPLQKSQAGKMFIPRACFYIMQFKH